MVVGRGLHRQPPIAYKTEAKDLLFLHLDAYGRGAGGAVGPDAIVCGTGSAMTGAGFRRIERARAHAA